MKKTIFIGSILLSISIIGCKNQSQQEDTLQEVTMEQEEQTPDDSAEKDFNLSNNWIHDIALNGSEKWEANPETTEGVENMLDLINETETETIEDYHNLGSKLNEEKNYIIKECTMEGPSHDNLHVFLHPLIDKVDALLETQSATEAEEIVQSMKTNLQKYYDYFK